ncbi:MAG: hypothetical protein J6A85_09610 [Clostridia bacterium]|nr:hypothetical protein [Clostridia bacterium]
MKNFIFACCAVAVLVTGTLLSSLYVGRYAEETYDLVEKGEYQKAYDLFKQKKTMLSFTVNGHDIKSLEEGLIDLTRGAAGADERVMSLCEEIRSRQRIGIKTLF